MDDFERFDIVVGILGLELVVKKNQMMDLTLGRDFLAVRYVEADVVILHQVPNGVSALVQPWIRNSPLHSTKAWKESLEQTGADYIFTFAHLLHISPAYLGPLQGYAINWVNNEVGFYGAQPT